jgi:DNA-binding GntR family transcriptional regulator
MTDSAKDAAAGGKLYEIVRDELIDEIKSGVYPPGALLPSMREITVRWTVSTTTARKVLSELVTAGYARSQGTKGYVATSGPSSAPAVDVGDSAVAPPGSIAGLTTIRSPQVVPLDGYLESVTAAADVRPEPPPAEVALALRLEDPSTPVNVRRSLAVDTSGSPVQLRISYTRRDFTEDTPQASKDAAEIDGRWLEALVEHTGKPVWRADRLISARHPTDTEAAMLALTPSACVLVRVDVAQDETGLPVDFTMTIWPGDTTRIKAT